MKYELRATVAVIWKGERRLVTHTREVDVVESWGIDFSRVEPEGIVVGEHGKIWAQGKVIGGMVVAGETGCLELQVKNHSSKRVRLQGIFLTRFSLASRTRASLLLLEDSFYCLEQRLAKSMRRSRYLTY